MKVAGIDVSSKTVTLVISTTTGIAAASAIQLLGELLVLPEDLRAKQWVAMAGLDPREHSSGSSVKKKPGLSKAGNRYLRMALSCPRSALRTTTPMSGPTTTTSSRPVASRSSRPSVPSCASCCSLSTPCSRPVSYTHLTLPTIYSV